MAVFVLDKQGKPLMPCSEKRARLLLERGRARIHRMFPFTIRLVDRTREDSQLQDVCLKLDPGSKVTGMALVREDETTDTNTGEIRRSASVLMLLELAHRGHTIRDALVQRRVFRRRRRGNLRYRPARFNNRTRPKGWLAPSLQHRVDTVMSWVKRLNRLAPVTNISQELVKFDAQKMQNPEVSGAAYQQGTLFGYEVREYLLEKWQRKCAYCGTENMPLEIDHIYPKSKGGSDRVSNLTLACHACNQAKNNTDVQVFLAKNPDVLKRILAQAKSPIRNAAAVNSTRWALYQRLRAGGLPVETASSGRTKYNRNRFGVPKAHSLDAACVGQVGDLRYWQQSALAIKAMGRGSYQRTRLNKYGFPRGYLMRQKSAFGFQTGDLVKAIVTGGKKAGVYVGRTAIRASGSFNIQTGCGLVQGIHYRFCSLLQRADGYGYSWTKIALDKGGAGIGATSVAALSLPGLNAGVSRDLMKGGYHAT